MNIFVAKLSPTTTGEDLQEIFKEYGRVISAKVLIDHETGRSKCFGFVDMEDYNEGNNAIKALNGSELQGSVIIVKMARPREAGAELVRHSRPKIEIGESNSSRNYYQRGNHKQHGIGRGYKRDNRYTNREKHLKPFIKKYTMMELMEGDD